MHDGASGTELARLPLGGWIEARHGAPYWAAHRRDVQAALLARAAELPLLAITTSFDVARIETIGDGVRAYSESGNAAEGMALVGADGQFSHVRQHELAAPPIVFSGKTAARTVLDASAVAGALDAGATGVWLASDAHIVHYPVRAGREIAVVAIIDEDRQEEDCGCAVDRGRLMVRLGRFSPRLLRALDQATEWRRWALFDADPLPAWSRGRVTLLGDAAHPSLPFLAQGGAMALEDAVTLADCLHASPSDVEGALRAYEQARLSRTAASCAPRAATAASHHLTGVARLARDIALRATPGARLMAALDWLYGWDADFK